MVEFFWIWLNRFLKFFQTILSLWKLLYLEKLSNTCQQSHIFQNIMQNALLIKNFVRKKITYRKSTHIKLNWNFKLHTQQSNLEKIFHYRWISSYFSFCSSGFSLKEKLSLENEDKNSILGFVIFAWYQIDVIIFNGKNLHQL